MTPVLFDASPPFFSLLGGPPPVLAGAPTGARSQGFHRGQVGNRSSCGIVVENLDVDATMDPAVVQS